MKLNKSNRLISGHALLVSKVCLTSFCSIEWLLDSDATDHISNSLSDFDDCTPVAASDSHIIVSDGRKIKVTYTGHVTLDGNITLQNVLFVPEFKYKLIPVHQLCKNMNSTILYFDLKFYL